MVQLGINLNPSAPGGQPSNPNALKDVKWARIVFRADAEHRTIEQAFSAYDPIVAQHNGVGAQTLFVLNQETYWGNGPWDNGDWNAYAQGFAQVCGKIAEHYQGKSVAYEIWNEGDIHGQASIFVPEGDFARVLMMTSREIKARAPDALIVLGGLASGVGDAVNYLKKVRTALNNTLPVDAIGIHPYGQWTPNFPQKPPWGGWFGKLDGYLSTFTNAFPNIPLWITEIGISEQIPFPPEQFGMVTTYMEGIYNLIKTRFSARVPVVIWFAWGDVMRNAGIVDHNSQPKGAVFAKFFELASAANADIIREQEEKSLKKEEAKMGTPYDGVIAAVHWDGRNVVETTLDDLLRKLRDAGVGAIFAKTNNGEFWQGRYDTSAKEDLRLASLDDVKRWIDKCAQAEIDFHAWSVVRGLNVQAEVALISDICLVEGVKSFIMDVEVGSSYFQGGAQVAQLMGEQIRLRIPDKFHLGLCLDARGGHPRSIFISRWLPNIDSLHPMTYHRLFGVAPEQAVENAFTALEEYGLPVVPMLQVYELEDVDEIKRAAEYAFSGPHRVKAPGVSLYVYGKKMPNAALDVIKTIKIPNPRRKTNPDPQPLTPYKNQDVINAFALAAEAAGEKHNYWNWVVSANLAYLATDRQRPYTGPDVDQLPGLSPEQKSLVKRALAGEDLSIPKPEDEGVIGKFTNQDVINAFWESARAAGERGEFWQWIVRAGLSSIANDRQALFAGPAISSLPNLTPEQRRSILNVIKGMTPVPVESEKLLPLDWITQIDEKGSGNNDCGQACVLMLLRYYGMGGDQSVKKLHAKLSGKTSASQLVWLAGQFGLTLKVDTSFANVDGLRAPLESGRPVILLVDYKELQFPVHLSTGVDQGWHWLVVSGYNDSGYIVDDPLWLATTNNGQGGKGGSNLKIKRDVLQKAMVQIGGKYNAIY
ncbi:MAG: C39 family peptidase [Anaerolineae bacterium]|nr:C39 family peptidase [Anaerolineae bacterium]